MGMRFPDHKALIDFRKHCAGREISFSLTELHTMDTPTEDGHQLTPQ